jgi:iron(III) transport system ATP-binding protein
MCLELRQLIKRLDVATLYVTHEQMEALSMSDTIAVMSDGLIRQEGRPVEIYGAPRDRFVANFIGKTNMIDGKVAASNGGANHLSCLVDTAVGRMACRALDAFAPGAAVTVVVRAEDVALEGPGNGAPCANVIGATVRSAMFLGDVMEYRVAAGDVMIRMKSPKGDLAPGDAVTLHIGEDRCLALAR